MATILRIRLDTFYNIIKTSQISRNITFELEKSYYRTWTKLTKTENSDIVITWHLKNTIKLKGLFHDLKLVQTLVFGAVVFRPKTNCAGKLPSSNINLLQKISG